MTKISGPMFDASLKALLGPVEYREIKRKAARMGGAAGKPPHHVAARNGEAMGLSHYRDKTIEIPAYCREEIGPFKAGKHYVLTVETGRNHPKVISPGVYQFSNWQEFLRYFKRMKMLK